MMVFRYAVLEDAPAIAAVEAMCFPPAEAAEKAVIEKRLQVFPGHFWLLFDGDTLVSFVDGMVSDEENLTDAMYENPGLHRANGKWQMIFGVNTIPAYRKQGCAGELLRRAINDASDRGCLGVVLTCKEGLIPYYTKFGFREEGRSISTHGNAVWYQMRLCFDAEK